MQTKRRSTVLAILAGVLLSISLGLYNNFPILYPDIGTYLYSGIVNELPKERPIFYGWFLRHTHMMDNLFFPLIAQGMLAAGVLYLFFQYFSSHSNKTAHYLLSLWVLACFTTYSYFVSFLMPDIFTALLFLCLACLFYADPKAKHKWFLYPLAVLSTVVHSSHFPIFLLCLVWLGARYIVFNKTDRVAYRQRWLRVAGVFVCAISISLSVNYAFKGRVFLSPNGHVFLMSRLNEMGILKEFLDERCATGDYSLCAYKDSLTSDFIWDMRSPFYKTGEWQTSGPEYKRMIWDMLGSPKYFKRIAVGSFYSTLEQLGTFEIEPHNPFNTPYIQESFALHRYDVRVSFQNRGGRLNFERLNERQWIVVLGTFTALVLLLLYYERWRTPQRELTIFVLWALVFNAFVCATFSTVLTRYQGRVIFLLPLMFLLVLPSLNLKSLFSSSGDEKKSAA